MGNGFKPIDLNKIKLVDFPESHYGKEEYKKEQIVLHHTVSGNSIRGDIAQWLLTTKRIGTCIIVERDGTPNQCFSSKYWAGHIGAGNINLDYHSIGVELDNWGPIIMGSGENMTFGKKANGTPNIIKTIKDKKYTVYGSIVDVPVTRYTDKFRGYEYYESYTAAQIQAVAELIMLWNAKYGISLSYNEDMWAVSKKALSGQNGIWTHCSYRGPSEKQDCHPDPNLISMLKSLSA